MNDMNEKKELTLNQEISKALKESEKLNDKILAKEKVIQNANKELNELKIAMIEYDEKISLLIKQRVKLSKKLIGNK